MTTTTKYADISENTYNSLKPLLSDIVSNKILVLHDFNPRSEPMHEKFTGISFKDNPHGEEVIRIEVDLHIDLKAESGYKATKCYTKGNVLICNAKTEFSSPTPMEQEYPKLLELYSIMYNAAKTQGKALRESIAKSLVRV